MSGGRFDYKDMSLRDEIFGYTDECSNVFEDREISELVWDVLDLIHDFDWYKSGDTGETDWLKAKMLFKDKWLKGESHAKEIIDKVLEETKTELYKTFLSTEDLTSCDTCPVKENKDMSAWCRWCPNRKEE